MSTWMRERRRSNARRCQGIGVATATPFITCNRLLLRMCMKWWKDTD